MAGELFIGLVFRFLPPSDLYECIFLCFLHSLDVTHHSAEGHRGLGGDVGGNGPHLHQLPE